MPGIAALAAACISLSTDAFAASVARGTTMRTRNVPRALRIGAIFGTTEGLMCLGGSLLALTLGGMIDRIDHWAALVLLTIIGARMIREGLGPDDDGPPRDERRSLLGTVATALGTSIDAAAVGAAFTYAGAPLIVTLFVGLTSFAASTIGFALGPSIGLRFGKRAETAGGAVLILIGVSIFWQHVTPAQL